MERLTTDAPTGNFETMLNFVHGKNGWAHIYDADGKEVNLITWALNQCHDRGCDDFQCKTLEGYDEVLSSCMMNFMDCPVAMAYSFASQAVHLRSRLKLYEDTMPLVRTQELAQAEKDGRLVVLPDAKYTDADGEKALQEAMFTCGNTNNPVTRYTADAIAEKLCREAKGENQPLILDELRGMDGEPVWVESINGPSGWCLVARDGPYNMMVTFYNEWCGKTWLAYRRKPEEVTP